MKMKSQARILTAAKKHDIVLFTNLSDLSNLCIIILFP